MAKATRTTNPLPFQDLEPRRFEDLVRQLAYDFRPWRKLEATGRSGSDGSFDARGYEIVPGEDTSNTTSSDDVDAPATEVPDRLWLIQCKRERSITPKKLREYLNEIPADTGAQLYGVVFAAACDFSKATRDVLNDWARAHGVSEAHMWGKGELEDQLYQPKNDNLLFAYFGISLQIRRRSIRTELRSRLAIKKRAESVLGEHHHAHRSILLRDPTDDSYPHTDDPAKNYRGRWRIVTFSGQSAYGLKYLTKRLFAYADDQQKGWDIVEAVNDAAPLDDHWGDGKQGMSAERHRVLGFWSNIPDQNRAWYIEEHCISYEYILAIDEKGDEFASCPHVFLEPGHHPEVAFTTITYSNSHIRSPFHPNKADRVRYFPEVFPEPSPSDPEPARPGEDARLGRLR